MEAVYELLDDRAHAEAMGARGRERIVQNFMAAGTARQIGQINNRLL